MARAEEYHEWRERYPAHPHRRADLSLTPEAEDRLLRRLYEEELAEIAALVEPCPCGGEECDCWNLDA